LKRRENRFETAKNFEKLKTSDILAKYSKCLRRTKWKLEIYEVLAKCWQKKRVLFGLSEGPVTVSLGKNRKKVRNCNEKITDILAKC